MRKIFNLIPLLIVMLFATPASADVVADVGYDAIQYEALAIGVGSGDVVATVAVQKERTILAVSSITTYKNKISTMKTIFNNSHDRKWKDRPAWA